MNVAGVRSSPYLDGPRHSSASLVLGAQVQRQSDVRELGAGVRIHRGVAQMPIEIGLLPIGRDAPRPRLCPHSGSLGAGVVVNFSSSEKAARDTVASIERLGGTAVAIRADVSRVTDIERLFAAAVEQFGRLDIGCIVQYFVVAGTA